MRGSSCRPTDILRLEFGRVKLRQREFRETAGENSGKLCRQGQRGVPRKGAIGSSSSPACPCACAPPCLNHPAPPPAQIISLSESPACLPAQTTFLPNLPGCPSLQPAPPSPGCLSSRAADDPAASGVFYCARNARRRPPRMKRPSPKAIRSIVANRTPDAAPRERREATQRVQPTARTASSRNGPRACKPARALRGSLFSARSE